MREEHQSLEAVGVLTVEDSLNQVQTIQSLHEHQAYISVRMEENMKIHMI